MTNNEDYKFLYEDLERKFSNLLMKHSDLTLKCERYEDKCDEYEYKEIQYAEIIEKLHKELGDKTWLLSQYLLKYPEYYELLEKKRSRIKKRTQKNEDSEEVEL